MIQPTAGWHSIKLNSIALTIKKVYWLSGRFTSTSLPSLLIYHWSAQITLTPSFSTYSLYALSDSWCIGVSPMRVIQLLGKDPSPLFVAGNSTPNKTICTLINALNHALATPPVPEDLHPSSSTPRRDQRDVRSLLFWADRPELSIRKHRATGHNVWIITDRSGNIVVIFKPHIGRVYDLTALHEAGRVLDALDPKHLTVNKDSWGRVWHARQK